MDKNKLKQLVAGVAEIKERKPLRGSGTGLSIEVVTELDELTGEKIQITKQIPTSNETLGWEIVKLKEVPKQCELGCGDIVCNQVVERRFAQTPKPHWKTRCRNCGCFVTPDGQGFVNSGIVIQNLYVRHFNGTAPRPVIKPLVCNPDQITVHHHREKTRKSNWILGPNGEINYQENNSSTE